MGMYIYSLIHSYINGQHTRRGADNVYVKATLEQNTRAAEQTRRSSFHAQNVCSSAACARTIGSAAASRPAKRASDLDLPAGRIEHGRPDHLFCHRPASARCSHESPAPVARLNDGAIFCALTREDGAFLSEENTFLAGATLAASAHVLLAGWRSHTRSIVPWRPRSKKFSDEPRVIHWRSCSHGAWEQLCHWWHVSNSDRPPANDDGTVVEQTEHRTDTLTSL